MTANTSSITEQNGSPNDTYFITTWKQSLLVSGVAHLKLPSSFKKSSKPKRVTLSTLPSSSIVVYPDQLLEQSRVPHWDHCREYVNHPLPLAEAIQYSNSASAFPLSSLKFLNEIYSIRDEHQQQFKEFLRWVPTILSKHHPALASHILEELNNTRACLSAILPSTQMSIPATSCFANEQWLDIDCLQACLDALNHMYNNSGKVFILPIDLTIYVTSNDDHSDYYYERTFDVKSLNDILGIFPMKVEDCKDGEGCYCGEDDGCKDGCSCDDHCACNGPGHCNHAHPCDCEPDHWAFFWLNLQRSEFLFGDSLSNNQPAARIARLKNFIATTLHTFDQNYSGIDEKWPTQRFDMPKQPDNSGSCGVIALNTIQHALDPSIPIWTPENNQEHRAHLLELISRRKFLVKWSPSVPMGSSSFDAAAQFTPPTKFSSPSAAAESSSSPHTDSAPCTSSFTTDVITNSLSTTDTTSLSQLSPMHNQDPSSNTFYGNNNNNNNNSNTINNDTQPGIEVSTSTPIFSIDTTTLPIDYNFSGTVFETPDHALQTIYTFANAHQFPIHRQKTHLDPKKHKHPRLEIRCCYFGTSADITKKNDMRRSRKNTVKTYQKAPTWERTDCPWRIVVIPHETAPEWKVSQYGKGGAGFRHNHPLGPSIMKGRKNVCPELNTLFTSSDGTTYEPSSKKPRLEPSSKDPQLPTRNPETTLTGLFDFIRTGCNDHLSDKLHLIQSIYEHARDLFQNIPSSSE